MVRGVSCASEYYSDLTISSPKHYTLHTAIIRMITVLKVVVLCPKHHQNSLPLQCALRNRD